jgi:hypothetical protein
VALKVGSRIRAATSACELIVIKGSDSAGTLKCAGGQMEPLAGVGTGPATGEPVVELGKRYVDEEAGIELLCTKAGLGPLTFAGRQLELKSARLLPASD